MLVILVIPLLPSAIIIFAFVLRAIARIDQNSMVRLIISTVIITVVAIVVKDHFNCC